MAAELANDYAAYLNVDSHTELNVVGDTIEEMLTRLDEFETLAGMVRSDMDACLTDALSNKMKSYRPQLEELCQRVELLDQFVNRVTQDLDVLEESVERAKSDVAGQSPGRLTSFLKPFFFKTATDQSVKKTTRPTPTLDSTTFFSTDEFFPKAPEQPSTT